MSDDKVNPYSAPDSDLGVANAGTGGAENFSRFSAWGVFGLSIITLGIYPIYWLVSRGRTINTFHDNKIPSYVLTIFTISVVGYFLFAILSVIIPSTAIAALVSVCGLAYIVTYLWTLVAEHGRFKEILNRKLNPILTLFGNAIYFQYKINQTLDGK